MAMFRATIIAFGILLGALSLSAALDLPAHTSRVVDEAGILDAPTRSSLIQKLADLEARTTDQLVVVTLKSLQGTSIEDFGVQLGRAWQIGQKGKNNGVLLIVVPSERKVRIEVGYGLEGTLTDAVTRIIIESTIIPRFRAGDFAGGISQGVDAIIGMLTGDDRARLTAILEAQRNLQRQQDIATRQQQEENERAAHNRKVLLLVGGFMLLWIVLFVRMAVISHRKLKGHMRPLFGPHHALGAAALVAEENRRRHYPGRSSDRWSSSSDSSSSSSSSSSDSSSSSSSSDSSSGGGGDFGGGGASGSW